MKELDHCPHCSGDAIILVHNPQCHFIPAGSKSGMNNYFVRCKNCGAQTGLYRDVDEAREAWNRRA